MDIELYDKEIEDKQNTRKEKTERLKYLESLDGAIHPWWSPIYKDMDKLEQEIKSLEKDIYRLKKKTIKMRFKATLINNLKGGEICF